MRRALILLLGVLLQLFGHLAYGQAQRWQALGPDYGGVNVLARDPADFRVIYAGTFFGGLYRSGDDGATWSYVPSPAAQQNVLAVAVHPVTPGTLYLGVLAHGVYKSTDGGQTWRAVNEGLDDLNISSLAIDPFTPQRLIAATALGPFISENGGATWARLRTGPLEVGVQAVAFDPQRRGHWYLGTKTNAVMRTADGGLTWAVLSQGMGLFTVNTLRFDAGSHALYATTFAVTFGGVFKLDLDAGATTWQDLTHDLPRAAVNDLVIASSGWLQVFTDAGAWVLPTGTSHWTLVGTFAARSATRTPGGNRVIAATVDQGLLTSGNGDNPWIRASIGLQNLFVAGLAASAVSGTTRLLAGTEAGVYVSPNAGAAWTNGGNLNRTVFTVANHPTDSAIVYAGTERNGVFKSTDGGQSFAARSKGFVPPGIEVLGQSPGGAHVAYAGSSVGLFLSRDNGDTWQLATQVPIFDVRSIAFDPFRPGAAFFGTGEGKVFATRDDGFTFTEAGPGLPPEGVTSLAVSAVNEVFPIIYAVTASGRLFTSPDDGKSWFDMGVPSASPLLAVAVHRASPATLYVATAANGVLKSTDRGSTWAATGAGIDPPIALALAFDASGGTLYAASRGKVYRSTNGGAGWTSVSGGIPPDAIVRAVRTDETDANVLYAQVEGLGVLSTSDGGGLWFGFGLTASVRSAVTAVGVGSGTPRRLFAATALDGVFTSENRGSTWRASSDGMTMFARAIATRAPNASRVYAASLFGGVFRSDDAAETWRNSGLVGRVIQSLAIDPAQPTRLYAGTANGIARSTDEGATWEELGQRSQFVYSLLQLAGPGAEGTLFVGATNGGLFRSTDGGVLFADANAGLPRNIVIDLLHDGPRDALYALLAGRGLYRSRDRGATWRLLLDRDWVGREITSMAVDAGGRIYAGTDGVGMLVSTNDGMQWGFDSEGLEAFDVARVVADPAAPHKLYAAVGNAVYVRDTSLPPPFYWLRSATGLPSAKVIRLGLDARRPGLLLAATLEGVYRSTDGAATWTASNDGLGASRVQAFAFDAGSVDIVFAGTGGDGISRSDDGGRTWNSAITGLGSAEILALAATASPGTLFAGGLGSGVEKTTNGGARWSGGVNPLTLAPVVHAIGLSALQPGLIYVATGGRGVIKSTNAGLDWTVANEGLEDLDLWSLAVDPQDPQVAYVGTRFNGVYMTRNGGGSWTQLPTEGLYSPFIDSVVVDPLDRNTIYVGTEGGGLFKFSGTNVLDARAASQVVIASSANPSVAGRGVTFTATVSGASGLPTGNVQFQVDGGVLAECAVVPLVGGQASCATTSLTPGTHDVTAHYGGSGTYRPRTSLPIAQRAREAPPVSVTTSRSPASAGEPVTFTAVVFGASGPATGTVRFLVDGATVAGCEAVALATDGARCSTSALARGLHRIAAEYLGDATYLARTSEPIDQVIDGPRRAMAMDFNDDGFADIAWEHTDGRSALWTMRGATQTGGGVLLSAGTGWHPVLFADFDGDRKADIVWQHADGRSALWLMDGGRQVGGGALLGAGSGWTPIRAADFDGDGQADLLWRHADGRVAIWLMDGALQVGGASLVPAATGWSPKLLADFDGDGRADIVWTHTDGRVAIWIMHGATQAGGGIILGAGTGWTPRFAGDFDGDGKADLVWEHADGRSAVWFMDGARQAGGAGLLPAGTGWQAVALGDFNGDGRADVAWAKPDGSLAYWLMKGGVQLAGVRVADAGSGLTVRRVADFDGDGRSDMLLSDAGGAVRMLLVRGATWTSQGLLAGGLGWSVSGAP